MHTYTYTYTHTYKHSYIHTYTHTYTHTYIQTHTQTHIAGHVVPSRHASHALPRRLHGLFMSRQCDFAPFFPMFLPPQRRLQGHLSARAPRHFRHDISRQFAGAISPSCSMRCDLRPLCAPVVHDSLFQAASAAAGRADLGPISPSRRTCVV